MQVVEFLRLATRGRSALSGADQARFDELDRRDEEIGNGMAAWEIPAVLTLGALMLFLLALVF